MMKNLGNQNVNEVYEAELAGMPGWEIPSSNATIDERRKFITSKYQYKGFLHRELLETNENDLLNSLCTAVYKNDLKLVHKYLEDMFT